MLNLISQYINYIINLPMKTYTQKLVLTLVTHSIDTLKERSSYSPAYDWE